MKPILVINDDQELLNKMTSILNEKGLKHVAATTGARALAIARGLDFSVVFLDLKLEDMEGDELYDKLIEREEQYTLPVVALLDTLDPEELPVINRLLPKGPVTLITKPLDESAFLELCNQYNN